MQKRNKYMVDMSNRVIGVYNKNGGGTMQTLSYAYKTKKDVLLIKPKFLK